MAPPLPSHRKHTTFLEHLIHKNETHIQRAAEATLQSQLLQTESSGLLEPETPLERTYKVSQRAIMQSDEVDDNTRSKMLDLRLNDSYAIRYTHTGRHMVLGGSHGKLSLIDALRCTTVTEIALEDQRIRDVTPLHNYTLFAAAQTKYVYIYDQTGVEVHQLREHIEPLRLQFLRHHLLLASIGRPGYLKYQDMSTGELVASIRTKLGPCSVLESNPATAVLGTGHQSGVVCLWAPSQASPLVKMLCHTGPVLAVGFDETGRHLVTSGLDDKVTLWDARMFGRAFSYHATPRPASHLAISQRGLLAMGCGNEVRVFADGLESKQRDPYMVHRLPDGCQVAAMQFRPYEDVLGVGHSQGVQTLVVPGAGEANFDSFEANPFERANQRREAEVQLLLDKIPYDMIALPTDTIGGVSQVVAGVRKEEVTQRKQEEAQAKKLEPPKRKMKGRGKIGNKLKNKHRNIWTTEREKQRETEKKREMDEEERSRQRVEEAEEGKQRAGDRALKRFKR